MRKGLIYMSNVKNVIVSIITIMVLVAPLVYNDLSAHYEHETVIVHEGDTVFSLIAEREYSGDIRESVYRTREENGLEGNQYLQPGDELTLVIRKK